MKITIDLPDSIVNEINNALGGVSSSFVEEWINFDVNERYQEISDNIGFENEVEQSRDAFSDL
jgi:hypothetical protein